MSTDPGFTFGGNIAGDYDPDTGSGTWIRAFNQPTTQLRIIPSTGVNREGEKVFGPDSWPTEREHYEEGIGFFGCARDHGQEKCLGCSSDVERVRKRSRRYYVNALDKDGEQRIFKMGTRVFQVFQQRHQRAVAMDPSITQPLSARDYFVHRTGSGLETSYDVEGGDPYPVTWPEELLSIPQALMDAYLESMAAYEARAAGDRRAANPAATPLAPSTASRIGQPAAAPVTNGHSTPAAEPVAAAAPPEEQDGQLPDTPTPEQIAEADTPEIKRWLTTKAVEFPARAQRSTLVKLAQAATIPF